MDDDKGNIRNGPYNKQYYLVKIAEIYLKVQKKRRIEAEIFEEAKLLSFDHYVVCIFVSSNQNQMLYRIRPYILLQLQLKKTHRVRSTYSFFNSQIYIINQ